MVEMIVVLKRVSLSGTLTDSLIDVFRKYPFFVIIFFNFHKFAAF